MPDSTHAHPVNANEVSQALAQDPQAGRFKKLLIYSCTGIWESDAGRLESIQFCDLLHTLTSTAPTWQVLQTCLLQAVNRLNKSAEYTLVAHSLLGFLQFLYPGASLNLTTDSQIYEAIAQPLAHDPDLLRLKKLLILACTNQWESNREKLEQATLPPLIQTLHSMTPSQSSLGVLLESLVKTLSKPTEYRLLANRLMEAMQPLYPDAAAQPSSEAMHEETYVADEGNPVEQTQQIPTQQPDGDLPSTPAKPETASLLDGSASRSLTATKFSTIAEATAALSALLNEQNRRSNGTAPTVTEKSWLTPADRSLNQTERFRLRQSVVQASNPLRTKVLLFSLLHEPFQLQQHESILKDHDLDDLLQMTLQAYPQTADLDAALQRVARKLSHTEDYLQSTGAVVQAVHRFATESLTLPGQTARPFSRGSATRVPAGQATAAEYSECSDSPLTVHRSPGLSGSTIVTQAPANPAID
ncbi:hypothetical protein [Leptolyngbya ohadii]|uniref:hypothetical protein n=1 Tax=Leptolyngbya ohadii TaxID=1962290 RepID=UPI001179A529|nr:hypothetical protein [Leptolyngbya ohadii]